MGSRYKIQLGRQSAGRLKTTEKRKEQEQLEFVYLGQRASGRGRVVHGSAGVGERCYLVPETNVGKQ
jgi:hypothetical protein